MELIQLYNKSAIQQIYSNVLQLSIFNYQTLPEFIKEDLKGKSKEEMQTYCGDVYFKIYDDKIEEFREQFLPVEKMIVLRTMDRNWIEHIDMMSKLREGIHLRSYAQNNPLQAYVSEGYEMFEEMMERIAREVVFFALKLQIQKKEGKA